MFICNQCVCGGEKKSISVQNLPLFCTAVGDKTVAEINFFKMSMSSFFPWPPSIWTRFPLSWAGKQPLSFYLPLTRGSRTLFFGSKFSAIVQQTKTTSEWLKASVKPFQTLDKRLSGFLMMVNSSCYSKCWTTAIVSRCFFSKPLSVSSSLQLFSPRFLPFLPLPVPEPAMNFRSRDLNGHMPNKTNGSSHVLQ